MIRFQGELSKECKNKILRPSKYLPLFASVFIAILSFVFMSLAWGEINAFVLMMPAMAIVIGITSYLHVVVKEADYLPTEVVIDSAQECIYVTVKKEIREMSFEGVNYVLDKGNYYDLIFFSGVATATFVCQKDLIVEGSIEEFEELFKDKLERSDEDVPDDEETEI